MQEGRHTGTQAQGQERGSGERLGQLGGCKRWKAHTTLMRHAGSQEAPTNAHRAGAHTHTQVQALCGRRTAAHEELEDEVVMAVVMVVVSAMEAMGRVKSCGGGRGGGQGRGSGASQGAQGLSF